MLAILNNCLAIFASNHKVGFVFCNDAQHHENKGAQKIAEHRLCKHIESMISLNSMSAMLPIKCGTQ